MCSVIGFTCEGEPQPEAFNRLRRLWEQSRIRGLHAFGMTVRKPDGATLTLKGFQQDDPVETMRKLWPFDRMIGHCRYSTSGDYIDPKNNQPIFLERGDTAYLVFNGVISMKTKSEYEKEYGFTCETENDGEIALRQYLGGAPSMGDWIRDGRFSFAGLFYDFGNVYALRNPRRPLWKIELPEGKFVASTADIFRRAEFPEGFEELEPNKIWSMT